MLKTAILAGVLSLLAGTAFAADKELKVGDPAPALRISKWIKGKPVVLADGKAKNIYVVEFWATWCGPCIQSIPHLTKLANHFQKKDVVFIGVSVDGDKTRDKVEPFVKNMGKKMEYTVALDEGTATNDAYMDAAGVRGIPHAFIIGKDGKIGWHGHPMDGLDLRLAELTGDKEFAEGVKKIEAAREALQAAYEEEKWGEALQAADKLLELDPGQARLKLFKYEILALRKKDAEAAAKWGQELIKKSDDAEFLNQFSWTLLTDEDYEGARDLKLALEAAKKANDLSAAKNWSILDTYARALFETGSQKEALDLQKRAIEIGTKEEIDEDSMGALKEALERYEKDRRK